MVTLCQQRFLFLLLFYVAYVSCLNAQAQELNTARLRTRKTTHLLANLRALSGKQILFGHQDDLAYGVNWRGQPNRSDVKDVCGTYPAVFGWDVGELSKGAVFNIDSVPFSQMRQFIRQAYHMGSINTISWHIDNPGTGGSAWDTTAVVAALLPGGALHGKLTEQLDAFAEYAHSLRARGLFAPKIPIIFRPWHENTGHWFWWGSASCTAEEYIALWRFTVDYLREEKKVKHLLYAFSPSSNYANRTEYLATYPGDAYVDIFGVDYYFHGENVHTSKAELGQLLSTIGALAKERGKVAALTETGFETIPDSQWWTNKLLDGIDSTPESAQIAYLLVWRNAWKESRPNHFYAPYPGHHSAENFIQFSQHQRVLLNDRLPSMYRKSKNTPRRQGEAGLFSTKTLPSKP